jgi:hypothetical protein
MIFRLKDDVGAARHPCVQGDVSGVSPHDFHVHDAVMGLGRALDLRALAGR